MTEERYQPHVSADGRKINFSSADADNSEAICEIAADVMDLHESVKAAQAGLPSHICCGKWTPDEKYLAFQAHSVRRQLFLSLQPLCPRRGILRRPPLSSRRSLTLTLWKDSGPWRVR
jgi:hypothetical protein